MLLSVVQNLVKHQETQTLNPNVMCWKFQKRICDATDLSTADIIHTIQKKLPKEDSGGLMENAGHYKWKGWT